MTNFCREREARRRMKKLETSYRLPTFITFLIEQQASDRATFTREIDMLKTINYYFQYVRRAILADVSVFQSRVFFV